MQRPAVRFFLHLVRAMAARRIPAGAAHTPDDLSDDAILHAAEDQGIPLGHGQLLQWIAAHPDEILNFVLLILKLIAMFG